MLKIFIEGLIATLTFIVSFSASANDIGVTENEIIIGAHTSESGPFAGGSGVLLAQASEAYYNMINSQGGVYGRKIRWIRKDSQSLAPKSIEVTRDLVEKEKVFAIVGAQGASHIAVYKYLDGKGIPDLYFSDFNKTYSDSLLKTTFPSYPSAFDEATIESEYVTKHYQGKKVCFLQIKHSVGEEYNNGAIEYFKKYNKNASDKDKIVIGITAGIERTANQADSEIINFKQDKCDVIMTTAAQDVCPSAINYGHANGFNPVWIVSALNVTSKFISLLSEGAKDGIISMTHIARDKSLARNPQSWKEFEDLMNKNNIAISGASAAGYVMADIFVETLRRAGQNLTRASLVKAAESYENYYCKLCIIPLNTSPTRHAAVKTGKLIVTKEKQWVFLN